MLRLFGSLLKKKITEQGSVVAKAASKPKSVSTSFSGTLVSFKREKSPGRPKSVGKVLTKVKSLCTREKSKLKTDKSNSLGTSVRSNRSPQKGTAKVSLSGKSNKKSEQEVKTVLEDDAAGYENEDKDINNEDTQDLLRPAYMSEELETKVLNMAERMQTRDLSGDVPVASFAYHILKTHPSVRSMGLRERMDFLCKRWEALSEKERLSYLNHPLKGLL
ncbi:unnamed protein product [Phytomonas sp. Hart1]|nr:unnamed protein product [Phytomonas sp. Hart1]|eukprot:CCW67493.1 unnamed protein product [Phytomonas sp. isolate Hart1]